MEVDNDDDILSTRHRSQNFTREEVRTLVQLVDNYKHIILDKCTHAAASRAKDSAWAKIAEAFNSQDSEQVRTSNNLRTKWENLRKDSRILARRALDGKDIQLNDVTLHIISMTREGDNKRMSDFQGPAYKKAKNESGKEDKNEEKYSNDEHTDDVNQILERCKPNILANRSQNFSPEECSLLLKCVRQQKKDIFCKDTNDAAVKLKNAAWVKVTNAYNKLSPQKRSTKVLRTKFGNMKNLAKRASLKKYFKNSSKTEKLLNESKKAIKREPSSDFCADEDSDDDFAREDLSNFKTNNEPANFMSSFKSEESHVNSLPDPLSTVLCSDSGFSFTNPWSFSNSSENKEVIKLKMDLLNYKMENAKLERERIEEQLQADAKDRELRATEMALRLRAARLKAAAAENKLPPSHPALQYTPEEEVAALKYLNQYRNS